MRILVLSDLWLPFPGGAERLMFNLSRDLMRRGFEVDVLTGYENPQGFDGPPVDSYPLPLDEHGWRLLDANIGPYCPDVILTHHLYAHTFGERLVATGIPVVQVVLNGKRLPGAALAVYISQWVRDQAGDAQPQDIVMTPPAFDDVVASEHGDAIGFIKPIPHKGVELVYRIAAAMPERRFVILRGEWQNLEVIRTDLPNVEFMEPVDDIREFYARCRLVLMPSLSEDAGTVGFECALNGIPCLSSNRGGLPETNGGGILLDPEELPHWLAEIRRLDDSLNYARVQYTQRLHYVRADHAGSLDLLAQRIKGLAS